MPLGRFRPLSAKRNLEGTADGNCSSRVQLDCGTVQAVERTDPQEFS
jgi:hypothetical protein